jgi:hypothetical protein
MRAAPILTLAALVGCSSGVRDQRVAPEHYEEPPGILLSYEVIYRDGALDVEARFPPELSPSSEVSGDSMAEVQDLVRLPGFLSYRLDLAALCQKGDRGAFSAGGVLFASPSRWLVRPTSLPRGTYRLHVTTPPGIRFVTGVYPSKDGQADTYEGPTELIDQASYAAFGDFTETIVEQDEARIYLEVPRAGLNIDPGTIRAWVERAASGVGGYFGRFPLPRVTILVIPVAGARILFGSALGNGGAAIQVLVGRDTPKDRFERDWILTHETVHLGFPNLGRGHEWMEEGLATYLEPIIRARQGLRSEAELWRELQEGFAQGTLTDQEPGYEASPTWAHVYWGGALFFFLADLEIRVRTGSERNLSHALRGILDDGGDIRTHRPIPRLLRAADEATGVGVLSDLYQSLGASNSKRVDVDRLLGDLGVHGSDASLRLDAAAEKAWLRRSLLTEPR